MKVDVQEYLRLVKTAKTLAFWDIEATGLRGDYNSILVASVKPYKSKPTTFKIVQPGNDKKLVRELKDHLESFDCWVTYYGKGFDVKMLDTRLLKWGYQPVVKKPHIDMYYTLKAHLLTARRSQGHLLHWLDAPEQKMSVGAEMWNQILHDPTGEAMATMIKRCESDCKGLESLFDKTDHLIGDIKRGNMPG